jgi:hypothetical protein
MIKNMWIQKREDGNIYINEVIVRMRAGMLLLIPMYLGLTLYSIVTTSHWIVDPSTIIDTFETNFDDKIIYTIEAVRRTYDYTIPTLILFYALFEMIAGMSVFLSKFSPTIQLCNLLVQRTAPYYKPIVPKRFAWSLGASIIATCIVFFNPEVFASIVNSTFGKELLPTTENFMPVMTAFVLYFMCLPFMWLEVTFGFCVGCKIHSLLVAMRIIKDPCVECGDIFAKYEEDAKK